MTLGFVIGESKPTIVTGQTSRSLPIGIRYHKFKGRKDCWSS